MLYFCCVGQLLTAKKGKIHLEDVPIFYEVRLPGEAWHFKANRFLGEAEFPTQKCGKE